MKRVVMGTVVVVAGIVGSLYIGFGALLYFMQDALLFPAPGGISVAALDEAAQEVGAKPIRIETSDGVSLYGWYRRGGGQRAVVYFHGNAETVLGTAGLMRQVNAEGWDFAVIAYRGYPGSEGKPSEEGLLRDARALWDFVRSEEGIPADRIVIHGRSLGGGVAVGLAAEVEKPAGLVLESTFTSILEMAQSSYSLYPVATLLRHPFDSRQRARAVDAPVLVLHSDQDRVIDVSHGRSLPSLFGDATYVEIPNRGHNDGLIVNGSEGRAAYLDFLDRVAGGEAAL